MMLSRKRQGLFSQFITITRACAQLKGSGLHFKVGQILTAYLVISLHATLFLFVIIKEGIPFVEVWGIFPPAEFSH
jgi:hypothetical protein